jgi:MFS family permease
MFPRDLQYFKFCSYGFLKNLRFFDPFIILFFREVGLSFLQIGILISIRELTTTILEIPTGIIADVIGRKNAMLASFTSYIISFIIFYFSTNFYFYIFAMLLFANGEAFRSGTHKAMIIQYLKIKGLLKLKTEYYGHTRSWSQRGSAISSLIAGGLVLYCGSYKIIFLASIVPYILELFLMTSYPNELNGNRMNISTKSAFSSFKDFLKSNDFRKGILSSSIFAAAFKSVKDYLQPLLKSTIVTIPILLSFSAKQRSSILVAIVYFFLFFLTAFASQNSGNFQRKMKSITKSMNITFVFGILIIIFTGLTYHLKIYVIAIILFIILYLLQNLRRPLAMSYLSEIIPTEYTATGLSIESQLKTILVTFFAPILGFFADKFGVGEGIVIFSIILLILYPLAKLKK